MQALERSMHNNDTLTEQCIEGKCASKGRKKGPLEGRPDQEKDEV